MKKFMAVFTGNRATSPKSAKWDAMDEQLRNERMQAGMKAWHGWVSQHESVITDGGGPLGKTKLVNESGVSNISNSLSGYTIVTADSHEAAARLFENHPHFTIFPGDGVEIMEIMPIPGL